MRPASTSLSALIAGLTVGLMCGSPALADDSEIFTSTAYTNANKVRPNILFIIDTSGSMQEPVENYDPSVTFTGSCTSDRIYWNTSSNRVNVEPPPCGSNNWVNATAVHCLDSVDDLASVGVFVDRIQQYTSSKWQNLSDSKHTEFVECENDTNKHGKNGTTSNKYAKDGGGGWSTNGINWNNRQNYTLYSANYVNWYYGNQPGSFVPRIDVVRDAAKNLADKLEGVNLGLMRYDTGAQGGAITLPVKELTATHRENIKTSLDSYSPQGNTPLSETLYEAGLYFAGMEMKYGNDADPTKSVDDARTSPEGLQYKSPMEYSCQKNYIVYLTDGLPTTDDDANDEIPLFDPPGSDSDGNANNYATVMDSTSCGTGNGECLEEMAGFLNKVDMKGDLYGKQNVTTFMIGFGEDVIASQTYLDTIAKAGGGAETAYTATNSTSLATTLQDIFTSISEDADLTFTSPTVSVNAFNRGENLEDIYVSVFSPTERLHWPGNLKRYKLIDGEILGQGAGKGIPAVDPGTGFFKEDSRSFWSTVDDGPDVTLGGAASKLPSFAESGVGTRKLVTHLAGKSSNLFDAANLIAESNKDNLTAAVLGIDGVTTTVEQVIQFARGKDVSNLNPNGDNNFQMGDPMHTRPAVVIYGGTTTVKDPNDAVIYVPTNDGYLHAIDAKTGVEKWAFVPEEFLKRLATRLADPVVAPTRSYALDGDIRVFKYDIKGDGIITPTEGDKVFLFFGFGRGGSAYYALDVTSPGAPTLMWKKVAGAGANDLPGLGKAWSTPEIARVNIDGAVQNSQKFVLIFAGGYDEQQESYDYATDASGNRVYMLDLLSGNLLWSAGPTASGASLELARMNNSIPAAMSVMDVNGDNLADRMYVGDMGGRVWRFDIKNGNDADTLVSAGIIAALGAGELETEPTRAENRRFYNTPDVALISVRGARPYYNIAIGSGYRGHPLETQTEDRFYSIRDYLPFGSIEQSVYDDETKWKPAIDDDMADVTTDLDAKVGQDKPGWKLKLVAGAGEKVLAEATTVGGVILFPTFQPDGADKTNPCLPATQNRAYAVYADNAKPFFETRSQVLNQGGIAGAIQVLPKKKKDPGPNDPNDPDDPKEPCTGDNCPPPPCEGPNCPPPPCEGPNCPKDEDNTTCQSGVEKLKRCVNVEDAIRTYWQRN